MSKKLEWDKVGERFYEDGVEKGVVYPRAADGSYPKGAAWNGLIAVTEKPTGAEANPFYANNRKYLNLRSNEEFEASIEAYTYPDEFAECDGTKEIIPGVRVGQQPRKEFGLSYVSNIGNDTDGESCGYKLHLVWGGSASPSEKKRQTRGETPEPNAFSWDLTTTAVVVPGAEKPTAHIEIDSRTVDSEKLKALEAILYGSEEKEARLPLPEELVEILGGIAEAAAASEPESEPEQAD